MFKMFALFTIDEPGRLSACHILSILVLVTRMFGDTCQIKVILGHKIMMIEVLGRTDCVGHSGHGVTKSKSQRPNHKFGLYVLQYMLSG